MMYFNLGGGGELVDILFGRREVGFELEKGCSSIF